MSKKVLTRIQNKHDTEANWKLATNFIPYTGEIIVYDPDDTYSESRVKIGDGCTKVNDLPFLVDRTNPPAISLLENKDPSILDVAYSTQQNGWILSMADDTDGSVTGNIYINDGSEGETRRYSKILSAGASSYSVNIRKMVADMWAGDYEFSNARLRAILNFNTGIEDGEDGWTIVDGGVVQDPTGCDRGLVIHTDGGTASGHAMFTSESGIALGTSKTYELRFKVYCDAENVTNAAFQIRLPYYAVSSCVVRCPTLSYNSSNSNLYTHRIDFPAGTYKKWHNVTVTFTTVDNTSSYAGNLNAYKIEFRNYRTGTDYYFFDDIVLLDTTNYLPEGFEAWTRSSYYYPAVLNATSTSTTGCKLETKAANVDTTSATNPTGYGTLCKVTNITLPSSITTVELSIDATCKQPEYLWQDYITMTPADKYNLLNPTAPSGEAPRLGGPWASATEPGYNLKFTVDSLGRRISSAFLQLGLYSLKKVEIVTKAVYADGKKLFNKKQFDIQLVTGHVRPTRCDFLLPISFEPGYDTLEFIINPASDIDSDRASKHDFVYRFALFGSYDGQSTSNRTVLRNKITQDYHGNIKCFGIDADNFWGVIDDGDLGKDVVN